MNPQKRRVAIISPSNNAYSETFIQAQKNGLRNTVFYYYGGAIPSHLENFGKLLHKKIYLLYKLAFKFGLKKYKPHEQAFISSLKKNKIEVVLAQYGTTAHQVVDICKDLGIPLITHFHGFDASVYGVIENTNKYKKVFEYSSYVIAVSQSMQKRLIEMGCPVEKVVYNTYGPDDNFLEMKPTFRDATFIGIGRFVNKKAPYYTILAFQKVLDNFPEAKLILGGAGELYETCRNLVRSMKLEEAILLPGILKKEEFLAYMTHSLAFVQHSITALSGDQEGTPVAILEASAAGLPVVSTIHAGIPDVIIDGVTGLLVEEHDVDGMAEKMLLLLKDKDLAKELGANGKERIKNNFTLEKHLAFIDNLIIKTIQN